MWKVSAVAVPSPDGGVVDGVLPGDVLPSPGVVPPLPVPVSGAPDDPPGVAPEEAPPAAEKVRLLLVRIAAVPPQGPRSC